MSQFRAHTTQQDKGADFLNKCVQIYLRLAKTWHLGDKTFHRNDKTKRDGPIWPSNYNIQKE